MRHALLRLTGLLVVLMLVLTSCNLIGVDPIMQLDEDFAALEKQYSGVVASYDGGQITQKDVMASLNSQYSYMSQLYNTYGISMTSDVLTNIEQSVVEDAVQNVAIAKQMESRGLKLSDEKLAEVQAEADEHYQEAYDSFYANASGENDEVRAKQTEYDLALNGYSKESLYNMELANANQDLIEETLRGEVTEVTDEELQAAYEEKVSEDEDLYSASYGSFESAMASADGVVCWIPEGYRTVKHILVVPESEILSAVTTARNAYTSAQGDLEDLREELDALNDAEEETETEADAEEETETEADAEAETEAEEAAETEDAEEEAPRTAEQIQADIDAAEANLESLKADVDKAEADCLASLQVKLEEIYDKLDDGEDFEALIEAYGEDPGMKNEPTKTRGYYVCSESANWDKNFTAGAMALANVGDYSPEPVISASGVHIIRYESDVASGPVALEDVKDALYEDTLEDMKEDHLNSELDAWVEALNPKYDLTAFKLTQD